MNSVAGSELNDFTSTIGGRGGSEEFERGQTDTEYCGNLWQRKCAEFLEHILQSLDLIVWGHISYMYLLDLLRLLVRSIVQLQWLTPKPSNIPTVPLRRSVIFAIAGSSAFSVLHHLFSLNPSAGEQTHGYLHGGFVIDFIGQEGPISKFRLVILDLIIIILQLMMLNVIIYKKDLRLGYAPRGPERRGSLAIALQDVERGEHRQIWHSAGRHMLTHSNVLSSIVEEHDKHTRLTELKRRACEISSGDYEVISISVFQTVSKQWQDTKRAGMADGEIPEAVSHE